MMKRKLGIILECVAPGEDRMKMIKETGFDTVFTGRYERSAVLAIREEADRLGITVETIHAPFAGINEIWLPAEENPPVLDGIVESVKSAAAAGIPAVVVHVSSGWWPPRLCDIGFERYDRLVDLAGEKGVKIAFENLRKLGNLAAMMERYERVEHVGFCYDFGHEHGYTVVPRFAELYGPRILCTHIHDNHSRKIDDYECGPDEHLLPFDGTIDYAEIMRRLNATGYAGPLTLEVGKNGRYDALSDREFLQTAFERIKKIAEL